jgi:trehalose 6-phosphate synthase
MKFFRMRLILALVVGITLVSVASTYFEVLAHKHVLRQELQRKTSGMSRILQAEMEKSLAEGQTTEIAAELTRLRAQDEALGVAVYNMQGELVAEAGPAGVFGALSRGPLNKAIQQGADSSAFGPQDDQQWLEEATPLYVDGRKAGALVILEDARYIRAEGVAVWRQSFWRIAAFVLLIVGVTLLIVRWFLMRPMMRVADRLRRFRTGQTDDLADESLAELSLFTPLAREVELMTDSLTKARAAAETEASLRDAGEHRWTAERLAANIRERFGASHIFVLSNREPYMHVLQGKETVCRCCGPVMECGWRTAAAARISRTLTSMTGCACRPTILATPCAGCGSPARRRLATTTALPTRGCGRSAILHIPGPSFALRIGNGTSVSMRSLPPRC